MLARREIAWCHTERQAVSNTRDSCTGDTAPGAPPLPARKPLGLVAGGAEAPGGARASKGVGSGDGCGRGASNESAFVGAINSTCGLNADGAGPSWSISEPRAAGTLPTRSESMGPRTARRFALAAVDGAGEGPRSSATNPATVSS